MKLIKSIIWFLVFCFAVAAATLAIFFAENSFSDETLFIMLRVLRYSSFLVFLSSSFLLVEFIARIKQKGLGVRSVVVLSLAIAVLFILVLFGAGMVFLDVFLVSISDGNV